MDGLFPYPAAQSLRGALVAPRSPKEPFLSKSLNLAVVGATGAAGRQMLELLAEREFPLGELRLFASERSEGDFLDFRDESLPVRKLDGDAFQGIDIALFAAGRKCAEEFCPVATAAGALCIDTSGAWSLHPHVPLVVPEVNPGELAGCRQLGIVASPAAASVALAMALKPLHEAAGLRRLVVCTYQAVSDQGQRGIDELRVQCGELLNGRPCAAKVFAQQIAFNCLPQVGPLGPGGASDGERLLIEETRRLLAAADLVLSATVVQVPVFYGHGAAVTLETEEELGLERARELLAAAAGIDLRGDDDPPTPVEAAGLEEVLVGRLREDPAVEHGLNLWLSVDNLRKGTATNAVQIAELLAERIL